MIRKIVYRSLGLLGSLEAVMLERATAEPRCAQLERLKSILSANAGSAFGGDHGFSSIRTHADYKSAVPVRDYEAMRPYIDRLVSGEHKVLTTEDPFMFATTSGTSGSPKYIPVTEGYLKEFRRASVASGYHLLRNFPAIAQGIVLSMASSAEEGRTQGGIPYGAISGGLFLREPRLVRRYISPIPYEVFLIQDWESRYYTLLRLALVLPLTCFYTLNPSTIVMLVRRLKQYGSQLVRDIGNGTISAPSGIPRAASDAMIGFIRPDLKRAAELQRLIDNDCFVPYRIWPSLQVVCCWTKAAAAFYLSDFPEFFGEVPVHDITYGASEGRGAVYYGLDRQLLSICSHFYEFIPEREIDNSDPSILLADELSVGENYYILFTTAGGLYRYHINDIVKVVGFHKRTPLLEFQYKGGNICSFTGEKISELHVVEAMSATLLELNCKVAFFTVVPEFRPVPHYELWIEPLFLDPAQETPDSGCLKQIASAFDGHLAHANIEYKSKRDSLRLGGCQARFLPIGSYERLRQILTSQGVADAQIKVSHLNPKPEIRAHFENELVSHIGITVLRPS